MQLDSKPWPPDEFGPQAVFPTLAMAIEATASGSTLTESSGCGDCSDAGAISQQAFTAASAAFSISSGARAVVGFGTDASASTSYAIAYACAFTLSYYLNRTRNRFRGLIDTILYFPVGIPGVILGLGFLILAVRSPLYSTLGPCDAAVTPLYKEAGPVQLNGRKPRRAARRSSMTLRATPGGRPAARRSRAARAAP